MHDVNVVIVNYKTREEILKCLKSLFNDAKNSGLDLHITIVDNGSDDEIQNPVLNVCSDTKLKFIKHNKNLGFARAQNSGIKDTRAKYHFALNPDTVFIEGQNVIKKMYDFMESNDKVGIAGTKIIYPDGSRQNSCYRFPKFFQPFYSRTKLGKIGSGKKTADYYFMRDFEHDETIPVDWLMGAAMFVRQKAIEDVGHFDERFWMYAEDSDWCRRMWEKNWQVYFVHDAVIKHDHGRGSAKVPGIVKSLLTNKLARAHLKSWLQYMWKWKKTYKYYT
jgi:GT2 family glycosyltransferase